MKTLITTALISILMLTFNPALAVECSYQSDNISNKLKEIKNITSVTSHGKRIGHTSEDGYFYTLHMYTQDNGYHLDDIILVKEYNCIMHNVEITWHNQSEIDNKEIARVIKEIILSSNITVIYDKEKMSRDLSEKLNKIDFRKPQTMSTFDSIMGIRSNVESGIEVHTLDDNSFISQSRVIYFYLNIGGLV